MERQNQHDLETPHSEQPRGGTTFFKTCFNAINTMSGIGILSVPYAFSQGGWVSLILLLLVAILTFYGGLLIKRCMDERPLVKTYPDIGEQAFGYKGRVVIGTFMYLELYLAVTEFLILEGDNLEKLFPNMHFKVGALRIAGNKGFMLLTALVILPTTWLRNLGLLAYISIGGVVASTILVLSVFWVGAVDGVGFHERGQLVNWGGLPTPLSIFVFSFCAHPVFPALRNSMKDTRQFGKVLVVCFVTSAITYGSMGIAGYLMFGVNLKSQVTLNLPVNKISSKIAIYTTLINPVTKYAVIITPVALAIENKLLHHESWPITIIIRTALVISSLLVALFIPFFAYLMAFIGAFLSAAGTMLFPCLCYLKIHKAAQKFGIELMIIIGILLIGSFIGVVGTYSSVRQIVTHLQSRESVAPSF